jgi:hypothetical protein
VVKLGIRDDGGILNMIEPVVQVDLIDQEKIALPEKRLIHFGVLSMMEKPG